MAYKVVPAGWESFIEEWAGLGASRRPGGLPHNLDRILSHRPPDPYCTRNQLVSIADWAGVDSVTGVRL